MTEKKTWEEYLDQFTRPHIAGLIIVGDEKCAQDLESFIADPHLLKALDIITNGQVMSPEYKANYQIHKTQMIVTTLYQRSFTIALCALPLSAKEHERKKFIEKFYPMINPKPEEEVLTLYAHYQ